MILTPDEIELLELAVEDYSELFIAEWRLRTLFPDYSDFKLKQRAQKAIHSLWTNELITFFYRDSWIGGNYTPVLRGQEEAVLDNAENWKKPSADDTGYFCFVCTDKGDWVYQNDAQVYTYLKQVRRAY